MRQGIIAIDDQMCRVHINSLFRPMILGEAVITIHVIRRYIQNRGRSGFETKGTFQLKTGKLQHVQLRRFVEQIQCWCP